MLQLFNNFSNKMIDSARKGTENTKSSAGKIALALTKIVLGYAWCIFIMAIALILTAGVTLLISKEVAQTVFKSEFSANLIAIVGIVMTLIMAKKIDKLDNQALGINKNGVAKKYIVGLFLGIIIFGLVVGFGYLVQAFKYVGFNYETTIISAILAIGGFFIQGFFEEFFFKSYTLNVLSKHMKLIPAVLISSILFACCHIFNTGIAFMPMINLFLFGIFTSCVVLLTDNIWLAAALHSGWNIAQGTIFGFNVSGGETNTSLLFFKGIRTEIINGGEFGPEGGLIVTCILLVATIVTMWLMIRKTEENQKNSK